MEPVDVFSKLFVAFSIKSGLNVAMSFTVAIILPTVCEILKIFRHYFCLAQNIGRVRYVFIIV